MTQLSQGQVLGRYELLLPVARGGMAEVWAARLHGSRGFRKIVAVKTILSGAIDSGRMEQMFLAEAELASRIDHPNVVHTLELGEQNGLLYLVLEWVEGESLSALLGQAASHGGVPLPIAVNLIGQACKGLHAAHELKDESGQLLGVVHRDISPQNILVSFSGTVKVVDFGIAKATQNACTLTEAGEVKGKLAYMAPEQLRGAESVDRRADIFSMGTLLYAMTTGKHPFRGDHPGATLKSITDKGPVAPPSSHVEDYPTELEHVVLKALSKEPDERFATAFEMLQALERAMPEALERSFDVKVSNFITNVAGTGAHKRQQQIREAGEILDRLRIESGTSLEATSPSSLSALAISGLHAGPLLTGVGVPTRNVASVFPRRRTKLWWVGAGAVVSGTVLGLLLARGTAGNEASAPSSQAFATQAPSQGVAASSLLEPVPEPEPEPKTDTGASAAPSTTPAPAASASVAPAPQRRRVVVRRRAPRPVPSAALPVASAPEVAKPVPPKPAPPKKPRSNAWDPDSFGARQ